MNGPAPPAVLRSKARFGVIAAGLVGLALATGVIGYIGFHAVFSALALLGWRGFAFLVVYAALPASLLGAAWLVLAPRSPPRRWRIYFLARIVRDAGGDLLPFTQLAGYVMGARTAVLQGISATTAASTTVVDVTTEFIAQIGFATVGIALLTAALGARSLHGALFGAALAGLALSIVAAAGFVILQRRSSGLIGRLAERFFPALVMHVADFGRALDGVYERPVGVVASIVLHLGAWVANAVGVWLALRFAGLAIGLGAVLAIESLVGAVRTAGFLAPMAMGVQEAAYGLIGPVFGLPADMAVAVSLIKRAASLAVGVPALVIWQGVEGRRLVNRASRSS